MMVKRFKAMSEKAGKDHHLSAAVRDSAQQIWLAGLGAFAKAQEEGQKVFDALVKEGTTLQKRTVRMTEAGVSEVTDKVSKVAEDLQKQANGTWDRLEGVFEERVARALARLGVPTKRELDALSARVDQLAGGRGARSGAARAAKARKAAPVRRARKAATA
jgi:poly(hydroxyalkanoate) granule-associated protein